MRIPSGVTDQVIFFVAVDATDFVSRETGLSSFTVYRSRNGAAAAAMTTPTVTEVSSANMPGVYKLLLDEDMTIGTGNDSEEMVFHITCSGMAPVTRVIELYRPKITAGYTLGVGSDGDLLEVNTLTGNTVQTGDAYAIVNSGTYGNSALKTLIDVIDGIVDAILVDTGTTVPAQITALNDLSAAEVNAEVDTALSDYDAPTKAEMDTALTALNDISVADIIAGIADGTYDLQEMIRIIFAFAAGKADGGGSSTIHFRDSADSKNRITATVDANGNRTAVSLDAS